ncbi:MAG: peptide-methionine (R)-S-oxide reductase [Proteobacteria bacterium]|nr:peptide-methionine (R)-S-oxide reductase [Pseudomonadota bacterium]
MGNSRLGVGASPFNQEKRDGSFVCAACYLPLFDSTKKHESGTSWLSFWQPLPEAVSTKTDFNVIFFELSRPISPDIAG